MLDLIFVISEKCQSEMECVKCEIKRVLYGYDKHLNI